MTRITGPRRKPARPRSLTALIWGLLQFERHITTITRAMESFQMRHGLASTCIAHNLPTGPTKCSIAIKDGDIIAILPGAVIMIGRVPDCGLVEAGNSDAIASRRRFRFVQQEDGSTKLVDGVNEFDFDKSVGYIRIYSSAGHLMIEISGTSDSAIVAAAAFFSNLKNLQIPLPPSGSANLNVEFVVAFTPREGLPLQSPHPSAVTLLAVVSGLDYVLDQKTNTWNKVPKLTKVVITQTEDAKHVSISVNGVPRPLSNKAGQLLYLLARHTKLCKWTSHPLAVRKIYGKNPGDYRYDKDARSLLTRVYEVKRMSDDPSFLQVDSGKPPSYMLSADIEVRIIPNTPKSSVKTRKAQPS